MMPSRQLHLFKGKRQKGEAPPPAIEFATCCALADLVDRTIMPGWRYTHLPFGEDRGHTVNPKTGRRYSITGQRLTRMGTKKGWPDYVFIGPERMIFWLEMKRRSKGRASAAQIEIAEHLAWCGFDYVRATTYEQAVAALVSRGIIRSVEVQ